MSLRVLHATPSFAPAYRFGGPMRSLEGLVVHLAKIGVDVRVLTTDCDGPERLKTSHSWTDWRGVPVRYLRRWAAPAGTPMYLPHVLREIRRADIVHVTALFATSSMQALLAANLARRPAVFSPRGTLQAAALGYGPHRKKRAWLRVFGPLLKSVALFHATSESEASAVRQAFGEDARVAIVPNGTDLPDRSAVDAKRARGGKAVIGFLGRIHRIKALENLVQAAGLLDRQGLEFELQFAGPVEDPIYRRELESAAEDLRLNGRVKFLGEVEGAIKSDFYAGCRVVVLPSHSENFGNAVIEALAHGAPVVASRGTPWEILERWGAGRWVDNGAESLAAAIGPYLRDEGAALHAGELGRAEVAARYGWNTVAATMAEAYATLVSGSHDSLASRGAPG